MDEIPLAKQRRTNPQLIGGFVARPAFLYGFQPALKQLQAVLRSRHGASFELSALNAMALRSRVCSQSRLLLITGGRLSVIFARKLLRFKGECAVRYDPRLGASVLSRRHVFDNSSATCVATLKGHSNPVTSVAFHPTAPLLATGSWDEAVRLWR